MAATAPTIDDESQGLDLIELNVPIWRRFFGFRDEDPCELCVLMPGKRAPWIAYATDIDHCISLMREDECIRNGTGVYVVPNKIHPAIVARYPANEWILQADAGRVNDGEIIEVRCIYIDFDARRPKNISSTDAEKTQAYELSCMVERFLVERFGDDWSLARADSGNGYSLFVALEACAPTKQTTVKVERFLKGLATRFHVDGADIDTSVFNPARLCPAFGTMKTKGQSTQERPHRSTHFSCRPAVRRVRLEDL